jgi:deoxycytidylate deaminase
VVASTFNGGFAMAAGYNGPPGDLICTGSAQCHKVCTDRCVHAEIRAIRHAAAQLKAPLSALRAVHVKVVDDALVAGGPPSCTSCAREVLDVGLQSFWLYQECIDEAPRWRQYTAREFYDATANFCGAEISL